MAPEGTGAAVPSPSGRAAGLDDALVRRLDHRVAEEQSTEKLPSVVAGLARDGELLWWSSAGTTGSPGGLPPDAGTQYRIGSISKTFTAVMVMRLRDEGALGLGDRIGDHLPELVELPVTVAQLLSHTAGLHAETPPPWWERVAGVDFATLVGSALRPDQLLWRPGRRFHYSNLGYAVLGELVSAMRGAPFLTVVEEELLAPLGMERTTPRPVAPHARGLAVHPHADLVQVEPEHDAVAMAPAGQLWSTITDLARWAMVLLGARPTILSPASAAEMAEPIGIDDLPGRPWTEAYGLGLQLRNEGGRRLLGHAGAMPGHWATLLADATTKDVALGLANSTYRGRRTAFFDDLLSMLASGAPRPPVPFAPQPADRQAMELAGAWYWGPVEHRIDLGPGGRLELRGVRPGSDCDFERASDGSYVGQMGYFSGERLTVNRRPDGSISHLDVASFVFTRAPYDQAAEVPGGVDAKGWHAPQPDERPAPPSQ